MLTVLGLISCGILLYAEKINNYYKRFTAKIIGVIVLIIFLLICLAQEYYLAIIFWTIMFGFNKWANLRRQLQ